MPCSTIQDKYAQKVHFEAHGVPLPAYTDIPDEAALRAAVEKFGTPLMLKAKRLAYDGRGNAVVTSGREEDLAAAVASLGGYQTGLYAEQWAPFVKELAVMVVRERSGAVASYPLTETVHRDSICLVTETPAGVPDEVAEAAAAVAQRAIASLDGAGIFGVEMFLLADGTIYLNEVAPRPHNSGHYTQDGARTSQFENHLRAVLGWPLGSTALNAPYCLMYNLLGEADGDEGVARAHAQMGRALTTRGAKFHWYGKEGVRKNRKVGHINLVAASRKEGREQLGVFDAEAVRALEASDAAAAGAGLFAGDDDDGTRTRVGIIMGSDSDLPTMRAAAEILEEFGVGCEVTIVSAHRTPDRMLEYARYVFFSSYYGSYLLHISLPHMTDTHTHTHTHTHIHTHTHTLYRSEIHSQRWSIRG